MHLQRAYRENLSLQCTLHTKRCFRRFSHKTHRRNVRVRLYFKQAAEPGIIHTVLIGKQARWNSCRVMEPCIQVPRSHWSRIPGATNGFTIFVYYVSYLFLLLSTHVTVFFSVKLMGSSVSFECSCHSFAVLLSPGYILSVATAITRKQLNWHNVASSNSTSTSRAYKNFDSLSLCWFLPH